MRQATLGGTCTCCGKSSTSGIYWADWPAPGSDASGPIRQRCDDCEYHALRAEAGEPAPARNFAALQRNGEVYVFVWDDDQRNELERVAARYASDPGLNFKWEDAAAVVARARRTAREAFRFGDALEFPEGGR